MEKLAYFIAFCLSLNDLFAQQRTFIREYSYTASEVDSKASCRTIALEQLRSQLLDELGIYVQTERILTTSEADSKFNENFTEKISTISAGITHLNIIEEKWDGKSYWLKASIVINVDDYTKSLNKIAGNVSVQKNFQDLKNSLQIAQQELAKLRKEVNYGNLEKTKKNLVKEDYVRNIEILRSNELFERAIKLELKYRPFNGIFKKLTEYDKKIIFESNKLFDSVLSMNNGFHLARFFRGETFQLLHQTKNAINDYYFYLRTNKEDGDTYLNRAYLFVEEGDFEEACKDFTNAMIYRPQSLSTKDLPINTDSIPFIKALGLKQSKGPYFFQTAQEYCKTEFMNRFGRKDAENILQLRTEIGISMEVLKIILGKPQTIKFVNESHTKQRWMYEFVNDNNELTWRAYDFDDDKLVSIK